MVTAEEAVLVEEVVVFAAVLAAAVEGSYKVLRDEKLYTIAIIDVLDCTGIPLPDESVYVPSTLRNLRG